MSIFRFGETVDLREHMLATYQTLRVVLVVIALSFPWVLWLGGYTSDARLELQGSMSAYYHAGQGVMRDWFVGVLFAVSALLIVYKGYRPAEDVALNLAGVFAVLVALFPASRDEPGSPLHYVFAVCFFVCIAYVCIFCASATLPLVREDRRAYYRRAYKSLGCAMAASPVGALILTRVLGVRSSYVFFAEAFGVYAFAAYWLVKTFEMRETGADEKAASGELQLSGGAGLSDALRELPVTHVERRDAEITGRTR